eukprot:353540-Chlamydomonas_euryale.AAC.1
MYVRRSIFDAAGWQVPDTWRGLATWAAAANGTRDMHALCLPTCAAADMAEIYYSMVAPHLQTHGPSSGMFFDPVDFGAVAFDSEAAREVYMLLTVRTNLLPPLPHPIARAFTHLPPLVRTIRKQLARRTFCSRC